MNNKHEIIERLLEAKHITVQEAMVLMETEKEYITTSPTIPNPYPPVVPYTPVPYTPGNPWITYCISDSHTSCTLDDNQQKSQLNG